MQDIDVTKLQTRLANDPLLNGSAPEILIDNDDTTRVRPVGAWLRETKGGKYGASMLVTEDRSGPKSVRFRLPNNRPGRYTVYVYNPIRSGGGGNPGQYDRQTDKANRVLVRLNTGNSIQQLTLDQQPQANDWISLGEHQLTAGTTPYLELSNEGATGAVVADAVLFVPVEEKVKAMSASQN